MDRAVLRDASSAELADGMDQLRALGNAVDAECLDFVAVYDGQELYREDGALDMESWIVFRHGESRDRARDFVRIARVSADLPYLMQAFREGRISFPQLVLVTHYATPETDEELAGDVPHMTISGLQAAVKRAKRMDAQTLRDQEHQQYLRLREDLEWGRINGRIPLEALAVLRTALERIASGLPADPELGTYPPGEVMLADALVLLASNRLREDPQVDRATVVIHARDEHWLSGEGWASLEHGTPIPMQTARRLGCDARVQLVVESLDGQPLAISKVSRKVPPWMERQVRERDCGCRILGCGRTAFTQIHHIIPVEEGGPTVPWNLLLGCYKHHRLVHEGGWRVEGTPYTRLRFIGPDGRVLENTGPAPLRPEVRERFALLNSGVDPPDTS